MQLYDKTVKLKLVGIDGNAFSIMGAFSRAARKQGWTSEEIERVITHATASDYNHLLATIIDNCSDIMGEDENTLEDD